MQDEATIRQPNRSNGRGVSYGEPSLAEKGVYVLRPHITRRQTVFIGEGSIKVVTEDRQDSIATPEKEIRKQFRALAAKLCKEHPSINMNPEVLRGAPRIEGTRLSVGTILAKLYIYGNIQALVEAYEPHLSEEQVKEAIAYAQDFLEIACGSNEP
jgi:uncharacterized protein (DUF433 family)